MTKVQSGYHFCKCVSTLFLCVPGQTICRMLFTSAHTLIKHPINSKYTDSPRGLSMSSAFRRSILYIFCFYALLLKVRNNSIILVLYRLSKSLGQKKIIEPLRMHLHTWTLIRILCKVTFIKIHCFSDRYFSWASN